jgi:hypothetical protein
MRVRKKSIIKIRGRNQGLQENCLELMSLFLTLVHLRLALPVFVMSDLFGVSCSRISSVFTTWIFVYIIYSETVSYGLLVSSLKSSRPSHFNKVFLVQGLLLIVLRYSFSGPEIQLSMLGLTVHISPIILSNSWLVSLQLVRSISTREFGNFLVKFEVDDRYYVCTRIKILTRSSPCG